MADKIQELILKNFRAVARRSIDDSDQWPGLAGIERAVAELTKATRATVSDPGSRSPAGGTSTERSTAGKIADTLLQSGLGLLPLVRGVLSIFGGGSQPSLPELVRYAAPDPIRVEQALWRGRTIDTDHDQAGIVRPIAFPPPSARRSSEIVQTGESEPASTSSADVTPRAVNVREPGRGPAAESRQTVVNVSVQAMDSRSFLDHSHEIARAVRNAMLSMNPINEVVSEL